MFKKYFISFLAYSQTFRTFSTAEGILNKINHENIEWLKKELKEKVIRESIIEDPENLVVVPLCIKEMDE